MFIVESFNKSVLQTISITSLMSQTLSEHYCNSNISASMEKIAHIAMYCMYHFSAHALFLKIDPVRIVSMCVCVCMCVSAPKAINN